MTTSAAPECSRCGRLFASDETLAWWNAKHGTSSLRSPTAKADAARLLAIICGHWGVIEIGLHWIRDVVLRVDHSTIATGHAPQNFAALRNAAPGCLRADAAGKLVAKLGRL